MQKPSIIGLCKQEILSFCEKIKTPSYRADQIIDWIYKKRVLSFDEMSNLSLEIRTNLKQEFSFNIPSIINQKKSADGSIKLLLNFNEDLVECVLMPFDDRVSLCVSTQIGCAVGCDFCFTATMGFVRNLSVEEIISEFLVANRLSEQNFNRKITHIVFMGMGEPFLNYENLIRSLNILTEESKYNLSTKNITVSTSGIIKGIKRFAHDSSCGLAISLGSANSQKRDQIMPINKTYPLEQLKEALLEYQKISGKIITVEYILISGFNTSIQDAKELVKFLTYLKAKVNLIPMNACPNPNYGSATKEEIETFQKYLVSKRIVAPVRYSRAQDIYGACGQLKTVMDKNTKK